MYRVEIGSRADRELKRLDRPLRVRIAEQIFSLQINFMQGKMLTGDLQSFRSLRVGDYRVIYDVDHEGHCVRILRVAHRREVYRYA